jgi:uncharacterized protein YyaL (SSP411 family)
MRPRPHLDDKVLTAWNGLAIAAFARAGRTLDGGARFVADAVRAAAFIREHLWDANTSTLLRRYRQGNASVEGYAEDYAYLVFGLVELFQASGDATWLEWALVLQRRQDELFWDEADGGWFSTTGKDPSVLLRLKEDYDGAEPAASSMSVLNLLALSHLTSDEAMVERIERTLATFAERLSRLGRAVPMMLCALSTYHAGMPQVVIVGDRTAEETQALIEALRRRYLPTAVVVPVEPASREPLVALLPWVAAMQPAGTAAAYVCRDFACTVPATSAAALAERLDEIARR